MFSNSVYEQQEKHFLASEFFSPDMHKFIQIYAEFVITYALRQKCQRCNAQPWINIRLGQNISKTAGSKFSLIAVQGGECAICKTQKHQQIRIDSIAYSISISIIFLLSRFFPERKLFLSRHILMY